MQIRSSQDDKHLRENHHFSLFYEVGTTWPLTTTYPISTYYLYYPNLILATSDTTTRFTRNAPIKSNVNRSDAFSIEKRGQLHLEPLTTERTCHSPCNKPVRGTLRSTPKNENVRFWQTRDLIFGSSVFPRSKHTWRAGKNSARSVNFFLLFFFFFLSS